MTGLHRRNPTNPEVCRARLTLLRGPQPGRKLVIDGGAVLGRSSDAQVQLEDGEISRRHARIQYVPHDGYVVEDLGSRNGTYVNGSAVQRARLTVGDEIGLGSRVLLRFDEADAAEERLLQQERLQALGRLSAGVAHDVNNMLSAVSANVDWLSGLPETARLADADVRESLADILMAAARAAELTRGILSFARGKGRGHARVDVSRLCGEVLKLLRHAMPRDVNVEHDIAPGLYVYGDRVELHQMLMNLCLNGRDAMPEGGVLRVELAQRSTEALSGVPVPAIPHAVISVRDSGIGMDEPTRARIFEPFFSTKPDGAGMGLGLVTVREVIRYHGGHIEVGSAVGVGSTFRVYLPLDAGRAQEYSTSTSEHLPFAMNASAGGELILLVDDEAVVQRSLGRLLKRAGFEVVFASSGAEALALYGSSSRSFDLVLMDMEMPGMSGEEASARLRQLDPGVRLMIMSGDHVRGAELQGVIGRIDKPCDAQLFVNDVRTALLESREVDSDLTPAH